VKLQYQVEEDTLQDVLEMLAKEFNLEAN